MESNIVSVLEHLADHEVVRPIFDGMRQGKHLAFMGGVVALRVVQLPAGTRQQAEMSAAVRLRQGGAERVRAGVKVESEGLLHVWMREECGVSKSLLQLRER